MIINNNQKGLLKDPRIRGRYHDFLRKSRNKGGARNVPGQDFAAAYQALNASKGNQVGNVMQRPVQDKGKNLQGFIRSRPNEQGGVGTPSAPASTAGMMPRMEQRYLRRSPVTKQFLRGTATPHR